MPETALVVMARYPEAGKTKTRLAKAIGPDAAAQLYQAFLLDIAERFNAGPWSLQWAFTPADKNYAAFISELLPGQAQQMECFPQHGAELGERLHNVFRRTHAHHIQSTIVIGSDLPHMPLQSIESAMVALNQVDVVLGPSEDGGYYLIAMRQPHDVFSGIPMSTNLVKQQTIELAQSQGLSVGLLEPLFDIDELSDMQRLAQLLTVDASQAPATAAHLATMKESLCK